MDYTVFRKKPEILNGSSNIGYLTASYERLIELFGESLGGDGEKTDAEWNVLLGNGHPVSIYNYKDGFSYLGEEGIKVDNITEWHVGGHFDDDINEIKDIAEERAKLTLKVRLESKSPDDLVKRLRGIANHIEEGETESKKSSDYHSWSIEKETINGV